MKCYVCGKEATEFRTGNAVCAFHASEEGFEELEKKALKEFLGEEPYCGDYSEV